MRKHHAKWALTLLLTLGTAWAQNDSVPQSPDTTSQQPPALGQTPTPAQAEENPPVSGVDQPALELNVAPRSFLQPEAQISESVDSNVGNALGSTAVHGVTRLLGGLEFQRLWRRYELSLGYVGGAAIYAGLTKVGNQIHQFDAEQRILWKTGHFSIRDSFSYLPEGTFGYGSYGGVGGFQLGLGGIGLGAGASTGVGGLGSFFGAGEFGALGQQPRITNVSLADVTQNLSARSALTAAGSYAVVHFTDNNFGFINSRQTSAQLGYDYQLSRKDQIALVYGFQEFQYPGALAQNFTTHLGNVLYGHRISGRMDFVIGGGPQVTILSNPFSSTRRVSLSGRASLRYQFPKTSVGLFYEHYNTSGSGFFAGAKTDVARLSLARPLGRKWDAIANVGYSRNSRIQPSLFGINATSYDYLYAGAALHRQLGRSFALFFSYQYNQLMFDNSFCVPGPLCSRISQRHVAAVGLDWRPRPIKLD